MATVDTELMLVKRFLSLLQDYEARPAIARRNTLPTLSRFLRSNDRNIRKLSLEAIYLVAEHPENIDLIGGNTAIVQGLVNIYQEAQYDDPELCEESSRTLDLISSAFVDGDPREKVIMRRAEEDGGVAPPSRSDGRITSTALEMGSSGGDLSKDMVNVAAEYDNVVGNGAPLDFDQSSILSVGTGFDAMSSCSRQTRRPVAEGGRPSEFIRSVHKQCPLAIILELPLLDPLMDTCEIEEILQTTRGVISYTITASAHQIRVFLSAFAQAKLQDALTDAGYENTLVAAERMRHQSAELSNRSFDKSYFYDDSAPRPSYLQSAKSFASSLVSAVMVYRDPQANTLAGRMQRQREVQEEGSSRTADRIAQAFTRWF